MSCEQWAKCVSVRVVLARVGNDCFSLLHTFDDDDVVVALFVKLRRNCAGYAEMWIVCACLCVGMCTKIHDKEKMREVCSSLNQSVVVS